MCQAVHHPFIQIAWSHGRLCLSVPWQPVSFRLLGPMAACVIQIARSHGNLAGPQPHRREVAPKTLCKCTVCSHPSIHIFPL